MIRTHLAVLLLAFFIAPNYAYAILPPEIIFNVGSQFVQFFSFIVLVVGGVTGSIILFLRPYFAFIQKQLCLILGSLLFVVAIGFVGVILTQKNVNEEKYLEQITVLRDQLEKASRVVTTVSTSTVSFATTNSIDSWNTVEDARKLFIGDTLYLYGNDPELFYLEIDLNRRQVPNGLFMHYYYLVGVYDGINMADNYLAYSSGTAPVLEKSLRSFIRLPFSDLSTRQEYKGTVAFNENPITFQVSNLQGDFVTRNSPAYTRYQSIGDGLVSYGNKQILVHVLEEGVYSSDFSKSIFFDGSTSIEASTRQFVLWDSEGSFYMIDQSIVTSDTPEYPSHTWLLYKNNDGNTKKGFVSIITAQSVTGQSESVWSITAPDFDDANIRLELVKQIDDGESQARVRVLVDGEITDSKGKREISGFGFIIE